MEAEAYAAIVAGAALRPHPPEQLVAGGKAASFRRIGRWAAFSSLYRRRWENTISGRLGLFHLRQGAR